MGDRPPQGRLRTMLRPSVGTGPFKWAIGRRREDSDFACVVCCRIEVISGSACRSGVGYPIITSIPRALVVVRTCRSALNMLSACVWRVGLLCYLSVNASCRSCSSGCSHAQPQHKSSNSALYSARYDRIHLRERRLEFSRCVYQANWVDQCFSFRAKILG